MADENVAPQVVTVPAASAAPAGMPPGSGEIDPPVTADEQALVFDMMLHFDAPSVEELNAEEGVVELPSAPAPEVLGQVQDLTQHAQPAPQAPVPPGTQPVQPTETVVNQQVQPQAVQPAQVPGQTPPVDPNAQGQPAAQAVAPGQELEVLRQAVEAQRENFVKVAAQSYEQTFTDADIEEFQSNPRVGLSKMAARLHADIVQNTLSMISAQVPKMITSLTQAQSVHKQQEDAFYGQFSDLSAHKPVVNRIAATYRAMNPTMDAPTFMQHVAQIARQQAGLAPQAVHQPAPQGLPAGQRPQAFRPAGSVPLGAPAAAPSQPAPQNGNNWSFIDQIMEADQNGAFEAR